MRFNYEIIRAIKENAPEHSNLMQIVFSIEDNVDIYNYFKDVHAVRQWFIREKDDNSDIIFLMGLSNTEARGTVEKITKHKKHQVGRPRNFVKGKKIEWHCHILFGYKNANISDKQVEKLRDEILLFLKKRRKKYHNSKRPQSSFTSGGYVKYINRQSEHIYSDNNFDWNYFLSPFYDDEYVKNEKEKH